MSIANQGPLLSCECFLGDILLNFHFLRFRNHRTTFILHPCLDSFARTPSLAAA